MELVNWQYLFCQKYWMVSLSRCSIQYPKEMYWMKMLIHLRIFGSYLFTIKVQLFLKLATIWIYWADIWRANNQHEKFFMLSHDFVILFKKHFLSFLMKKAYFKKRWKMNPKCYFFVDFMLCFSYAKILLYNNYIQHIVVLQYT